MKKLLVLFVAVAATISSFAATTLYYFNRAQFQWASPNSFAELRSIVPEATEIYSPKAKAPVAGLYDGAEDFDVQVTVPMVYQGTIALVSDWIYEPEQKTLTYAQRKVADCLVNNKASLPAVMTICQPCIDCYPCETLNVDNKCESGETHKGIFGGLANGWQAIKDPDAVLGWPGYITIWNLYVITAVDKKNKVVYYYKIDLIDETNKASFFTGKVKGKAYAKAQQVDAYGAQINLQLSGEKDDYKFYYYTKFLTADDTWEALGENLGDKEKAFIKSAKSLNGTIYYNYLKGGASDDQLTAWTKHLDVLDVAGTVKLTRNASLTGNAIKATFGVTTTKSKVKNWDDCQESDPESSTCEQYFFSNGGLSTFETSYFAAKYKKYEVVNAADYYTENIEADDYVYMAAAEDEGIATTEKGKASKLSDIFAIYFYNASKKAEFKKFYVNEPTEDGGEE